MCANSSSRTGHSLRRQRGFTLPELVAVMVVIGILAATALPKLQSALSFRDTGWRDQVVAALRYAHQSAIGHRRLVCADVAGASVTLTIASANPASTCGAALPGPDGSAAHANAAGAATATASPAGTFYFQPSGRVTSDGAGVTAPVRSIGIAGQDSISIVGETGRVD